MIDKIQILLLVVVFILGQVYGDNLASQNKTSFEKGMRSAQPYFNSKQFTDFKQIALNFTQNSFKSGVIDEKYAYVLMKAKQMDNIVEHFGFGFKKTCFTDEAIEKIRSLYSSYMNSKLGIVSPFPATAVDDQDETSKKMNIKVIIETNLISADYSINYVGYLLIAWTLVVLSLMMLSLGSNLSGVRRRILSDIYESFGTQIESSENLELNVSVRSSPAPSKGKLLLDGFNPIAIIKGLFSTERVTDASLIFFDGLRVLAGFKVIYGHVRGRYQASIVSNYQTYDGNLSWLFVDYINPHTYNEINLKLGF